MDKIKKICLILVLLLVFGLTSLVSIDLYVKLSTNSLIIKVEEASSIEDVDYILILGAGLNPDGTPSPMLKERLDTGIALYKEGVSDKIIVSGDHLYPDHDEVNSMKNYMTKEGIPSDIIYMDHAGLSTYDSLYRAKELFAADKIVVVTQKYHLYRSLYIGKKLNIEIYGVDAKKTTYNGQFHREIREILARTKDFAKCLLKPASKILGDTVPVAKGGNVTNDRKFVIIKPIDSQTEIYMNYSPIIDKISDIIEKYEFKERTCKENASFTMFISDDRIYEIELATFVHIVIDDKEEIILNEEDSSFFESLLK